MNIACRVAAVLSGALLIASSALAASDFLLEIDGVDGAATGAPKTIEVQSFSWGMSNSGAMATGAGRGSGRANMQDLSVAAPREASTGLATGRRSAAAAVTAAPAPVDAPVEREVSVNLPEAAAKSLCATGKHLASVKLTARGERIELEDVVVTSCTTQAGLSTVAMRGHTKTGHVTLMK